MQYRGGAFAGAAGRLRGSGLQGSLVASGCQWLRTCPCLCVGCCIGVAARERGSAPMWPDAARSPPLRVALPELPPPPVRAIHLSALSHLSPEASRV